MGQRAANVVRSGKKDNAIGDGTTRPIRTQTMYRVTGEISGHHFTRRISAVNEDAAMEQANAVGMSVHTITPISTTKQ